MSWFKDPRTLVYGIASSSPVILKLGLFLKYANQSLNSEHQYDRQA